MHLVRTLFCCLGIILVVLSPGGTAAIAFETGMQKYLGGDLAGSITDFSAALAEMPDDRLTREILACCLRLSAKETMRMNNYEEGHRLLEQAVSVDQNSQENRSLCLRAELQSRFPAGASVVTTSELETTADRDAIFSLLFVGLPLDPVPEQPKEDPVPDTIVHYTVGGETLATIAKKYYNDYEKWRIIWNRNPHLANPHRLFPGTRLIIPKQ